MRTSIYICRFVVLFEKARKVTTIILIFFCAGLSFRTTEEGLRNAFQKFGQLVEGETRRHCIVRFVGSPTVTFQFNSISRSYLKTFQQFWKVLPLSSSTVNLVMDKIANRPRGFAFLHYETEEESQKAIEGMHGKVDLINAWLFF